MFSRYLLALEFSSYLWRCCFSREKEKVYTHIQYICMAGRGAQQYLFGRWIQLWDIQFLTPGQNKRSVVCCLVYGRGKSCRADSNFSLKVPKTIFTRRWKKSWKGGKKEAVLRLGRYRRRRWRRNAKSCNEQLEGSRGRSNYSSSHFLPRDRGFF